jgi:hypothetical protein
MRQIASMTGRRIVKGGKPQGAGRRDVTSRILPVHKSSSKAFVAFSGDLANSVIPESDHRRAHKGTLDPSKPL